MSAILDAPHFQDDQKAREHLERIRWPEGPVCPHCGSIAHYKLQGKAHRPGLYKCKDCKKQFSVTVGTVFERSHIPLHKWLMATYLLCSSKKGISAHQLHRTLGITYKSAWFMAHRIREAMKDTSTDKSPVYGKIGKSFQSHETVDHGHGEYARGDVTTNTVEGYFGILKRGISGIYQHVSPEHLHRYVNEFSFRYTNREALEINDVQRAINALAGAEGKRLMYKISHQETAQT